MIKSYNSSGYIKLIPIGGICLFVLFYIIAAIVYPGGNHLNPNSKGFSVLHNYWCDLLNPKAQNGKINPSSPIAIAAMIIVCTSLIFFWYYLPRVFKISPFLKSIIKISGIVSMLIGMLIFTRFHDEAITFSGFFGGIAFIVSLIGLYKSNWNKLFWLGILSLLLGTITFAIYKTREGLIILPMIQKVTLLLCLIWIALIDIKMKRQTDQ